MAKLAYSGPVILHSEELTIVAARSYVTMRELFACDRLLYITVLATAISACVYQHGCNARGLPRAALLSINTFDGGARLSWIKLYGGAEIGRSHCRPSLDHAARHTSSAFHADGHGLSCRKRELVRDHHSFWALLFADESRLGPFSSMPS